MTINAAGTKIYVSNNDTPETWTEIHKLHLNVVDSMSNRARLLTFTVANPKNSMDSYFTSYRRVKAVELRSGQVCYLGRIISSEDKFDDNGIYIVEVVCSDYIADLLMQTVDADYSVILGAVKRSVLVEKIIDDWTYPYSNGVYIGSGTYNFSKNIIGSVEPPYYNLVKKSYIRSNQSPLQIIATLAAEEPTDVSVPAGGYGYDFYMDDTPTFQYFPRGSKGPNLTIKFGLGTPTDSIIPMLPGYSFTPQANEVVTRIKCYGVDSTGVVRSYTAIDSTTEASHHIINEKVDFVGGHTLATADLIAYITQRATALLNDQSKYEELIRGQFKIVGYPMYGTPATLVRVGELVHIEIPTQSIDDDFLVTEIEYEELPGISTIKVMSNTVGHTYSPFEVASVLQGLRSGQTVVIGTAHISDLIVDSASMGTVSISNLTAGDLNVTATLGSGKIIAGTEGGERTEMDSTGFNAYNSSNINTFKVADGVVTCNELNVLNGVGFSQNYWRGIQWYTLFESIDSLGAFYTGGTAVLSLGMFQITANANNEVERHKYGFLAGTHPTWLKSRRFMTKVLFGDNTNQYIFIGIGSSSYSAYSKNIGFVISNNTIYCQAANNAIVRSYVSTGITISPGSEVTFEMEFTAGSNAKFYINNSVTPAATIVTDLPTSDDGSSQDILFSADVKSTTASAREIWLGEWKFIQLP